MPEYAVFGGWVNLMGEPISNDTQFTSDAVLRANYTIELPEEPDEPIATTHTITFLDARNNPLGGITFTEGATKDTIAKGSFPEAPNLESENMGFRYWGVYLDNEYVDWDSDSFRLEDITTDLIVRPQYEYIGQNLGIVGVDSDGDGTVDYYRVDPVRQLDKDVSIPGMIMGLPVKEIDKLYGNTSNKDQATNVITINVGEGAEIIHTGAFEATPNLTIVYLPSTITTIEERAFAINPGQEKNKKVTINYNGTRAQWEAITATDWAQGLQSATVICTDQTGTYGKNGNGVKWT